MLDQSKIRNFAIIAHIDHGKTTLTDRFLQLTGAISQRDFRDRLLDQNPIEQERGVTIKLAPVTFNYQSYTLNLIDTPGHVDFSYEVERSLQACEGAVLLVDATQGIQAQTLSHLKRAQKLNLKILPVINKTDLPTARVGEVLQQIKTISNYNTYLEISAKTGKNVDKLLTKITQTLPAPTGDPKKPIRALIFNSIFHPHKGIIAFVRLVDGHLSSDQSLQLIHSKFKFKPLEIGVFNPQMKPEESLATGQVGYVATGIKDSALNLIGDTITLTKPVTTVSPLPGYQSPQSVVFQQIFPTNSKHFPLVKDALAKLKLQDSALSYSPTSSPALGPGFQLGFLGAFHAEITRERLTREFQLELLHTPPSVAYNLVFTDGQQKLISSPALWPDPSKIKTIQEPFVQATIFSPPEYLGSILEILGKARGIHQDLKSTPHQVQIVYQLPFAELITDFFDQLKSVSSGFASLEYEFISPQNSDIVKLDLLLNHSPVASLATLVHRSKTQAYANQAVKRVKINLPAQLFAVPIQVAVGSKILARETKSAYRKDVTAKLYGGDQTRKDKLLKKQVKGKKRLAAQGRVHLSPTLIQNLLK